MDTYQFFLRGLGKHLLRQLTNNPPMDCWKALSSTYSITNKEGKTSTSRLASGWAIVRPNGATVQLPLQVVGIEIDPQTRLGAFYTELEHWDGEPRIFLTFDKAPIPISNLFITADLRAVRICSPKGVETFDYTETKPNQPGSIQRGLLKIKESGK